MREIFDGILVYVFMRVLKEGFGILDWQVC